VTLATSFNLFYPGSTPHAHSVINNIHNSLTRFSIPHSFSQSLSTFVNFTYGYLGFGSRYILSSNHYKNSPLIFILDNPLLQTTKELPSTFRLCHLSRQLPPIHFTSRYVSCGHLSSARSTLDTYTSEKLLNIFTTRDSLSSPNNFLYIKPSSVFLRLIPELSIYNQQRLNSFRTHPFFSSSTLLVAVKKFEAFIRPYSFKTCIRKHSLSPSSISYQHINACYCPTSMLAVKLILHSVPTFLSPYHPLYPSIGEYIPAMSSIEAKELLIKAYTQSTFSIDRFQSLVHFISTHLSSSP